MAGEELGPQMPYKVEFPDGYVQKFTAPSGMAREDIKQRAIQERSIAEGKIATSPRNRTWRDTGRDVARGSLDALPAAGAVAGGILATPETGGAGTLTGAALGAGVGQGAKDFIGHVTGLTEPSTPLDKLGNIGKEAAWTAVTGKTIDGLVAAARTPGLTAQELRDFFQKSLYKWGQRVMPGLPEMAPTATDVAAKKVATTAAQRAAATPPWELPKVDTSVSDVVRQGSPEFYAANGGGQPAASPQFAQMAAGSRVPYRPQTPFEAPTAADRYMPNVSGATPKASVPPSPATGAAVNEGPQVERYMPNVSGATADASAGAKTSRVPYVAEVNIHPSPPEVGKIVRKIYATEKPLSDWEKTFVKSVGDQAESGRDISESQAHFLRQIATRVGSTAPTP